MIRRLLCFILRGHIYGKPYNVPSINPGQWKEKRCRRCGHREMVRARPRAAKGAA